MQFRARSREMRRRTCRLAIIKHSSWMRAVNSRVEQSGYRVVPRLRQGQKVRSESPSTEAWHIRVGGEGLKTPSQQRPPTGVRREGRPPLFGLLAK